MLKYPNALANAKIKFGEFVSRYVFAKQVSFFKPGCHQPWKDKLKQHTQTRMHLAHWYLLLEQKNHVTKRVCVACVYIALLVTENFSYCASLLARGPQFKNHWWN